MPTRLPFAILLGFGSIVPASALAGEAENWERLRSMPRERRMLLSEKLGEFDHLPASEKAAIRELDGKLEAQPADDKAMYQSVLRRYHLWLKTLSDDQRQALRAASPDQRLSLVAKYRAQERPNDSAKVNPTLLVLQTSGPSPFEYAQRLKVWFDLSLPERAKLAKQLEAMDLQGRWRRLFELAEKSGVRPHHLKEPQIDELMKKLEAYPALKNWLTVAAKKGATEKPKRDRARAENYSFLINVPRPVETSRLLQFETEMPPGFRMSFDHMPPEEAKRRLTVLYRLVFPAPKEIPSVPAGSGAGAKEGSAPRTVPGRPTGGSTSKAPSL